MAASKVNTKFVAILVGGLATVAVGGGGVLIATGSCEYEPTTAGRRLIESR